MVFDALWGSLNSALNSALNPLIQYLGPVFSIVIIAIVISLITSVAQKLLVDQDRLIYIRKEMKEFQQEMVEARKKNDPKALNKLQKKQMELMNLQKEMMSMSFKPMIVTFLPVIIIFNWMRQNPLVSTVAVELPVTAYYMLLIPLWQALPFYGGAGQGVPEMSIGWLGWYILCSFGLSILFRKLMGVKSGGGM